MLPGQILSKLVEIVLNDIAKDILSRQRDKRRKFAETMLSYYLSIKEYRSLCKEVLSILEQNTKVLDNRRLWPNAANRIQAISDRMSTIVGTLYRTFEAEWDGRDYLLSKSDPEARKRYSALEIYNNDLAQLVSVSNHADATVAYLIYQLSEQDVSFEEQKFCLIEPNATISAELLWEVMRYHQYKEMRVIPKGYRIIDLTDQADYQRLIELLKDYSNLLDDLVGKVADFIKQNFKIDEIL